MSKTIPVARTTFAHSPTRPSFPTAASRRSLPYFVGAILSFAAACALGGGACFIALGNPTGADLPQLALLVGALACATGLIGIGLLLTLRQRDLRRQEARRASRIEQIRLELDALGLTPRERTIAEMILQHRSYDAIATACHLSPRTVQFHASNIFRKAYVTRRREFEQAMLAEDDQGRPYERIARIRPPAGDGAARP